MPKDYADKHDSYMIRFKTTNEKRLIGKPRQVSVTLLSVVNSLEADDTYQQLPVLRKGGSVVVVELSLGELIDEASDRSSSYLTSLTVVWSVDLLFVHNSQSDEILGDSAQIWVATSRRQQI